MSNNFILQSKVLFKKKQTRGPKPKKQTKKQTRSPKAKRQTKKRKHRKYKHLMTPEQMVNPNNSETNKFFEERQRQKKRERRKLEGKLETGFRYMDGNLSSISNNETTKIKTTAKRNPITGEFPSNPKIPSYQKKLKGPNNFTQSIFQSKFKNGDRNSRIFIISGHSGVCEVDFLAKPENYNRSPHLRNINKETNNKFRLLTSQSLGRAALTNFQNIFINALKNNRVFHESIINTETDADCKNLNLLLFRYILKHYENLDYLNQYVLKKQQELFGTPNITDFKIYPKPKNPKLIQDPLNKTLGFYHNETEKQKLSFYIVRGVFEITTINEYGFWEIDDFMSSTELIDLFSLQYKEVLKSEKLIDSIMYSLRIPNKITELAILMIKGEEYLEKLNKFNSINRQIFKVYQEQDKKGVNLKSIGLDYGSIFNLINAETDDDDDILMFDNSCSAVIQTKLNKWNQTKIPGMKWLKEYRN